MLFTFNTGSLKIYFSHVLSNSFFGKLVARVPIATITVVPKSSTPYTMFGATASLVTTSAEDLHVRLFRVKRVRPLTGSRTHFSDKVFVNKNNINMLTWIR